MDMRDKQFDTWLKNTLNGEIPLSKHNRQAAWENIRLAASQPSYAMEADESFAYMASPLVAREALHTRIWRWISYFMTQETKFQKAHANSIQYYKANSNSNNGLTLYSLELMRHRWTVAV
jgi:hypothetical protein